MKLSGEQILQSIELQELLLNCQSKVKLIKWHDNSETIGDGKNIYIEKVNNCISVVDGLWSEPIRKNMHLIIENPNIDLYNVFTTTEAALIWGKTESTIRKAITNGKFEQWVDYRKSGRITLISAKAMERVYGKLE